MSNTLIAPKGERSHIWLLGRSSLADRVLQTRELLDLIFAALEEGDNLSCALVSKSWSDTALNALYHDVYDARNLFGVLVPLVRNTHGQATAFSRTPEPSDWIRFESYARRVRTFTYEDVLSSAISSAKCDPIHDRVWDDIARTRTTLHILPNLRELCWLSNPHGLRGRSQLAHCLMLLPPGLSHLSARVSNIDDMDATSGGGFRPFAQNVLGRVPTLSTLDIHSSIPVSSIEPEFLALLAGLPALREVILPGYWLTSRVTEALSQLPKLHVVQYELFQPDRLGDPDDVASFDPQLKEGAFPALEDLSLAATVPDISRFFQSPYAPVELTHLFIHSPLIVPTAETVSSLLVHLGRNLPRLRELYLELRVGEAALRHGDKLPISALMPLSGFAALRVFEIYCMAPLQLTILELDTFAAALPPLEKLQLNPEPFLGTNGLSGSSLPIDALFIFAQRCPQLLELGLFVTVFGTGIPGNNEFISDSGASLPPPLRKMRVLNFGSSPILFAPQASGTVAKWLSQICSSACQITSGYTWDPVSLGYPESSNSQASCAAWEEAGRLLPLFSSLREEERSKREAQEKEIDDLRTRNRVLMETRSMRMGGVLA